MSSEFNVSGLSKWKDWNLPLDRSSSETFKLLETVVCDGPYTFPGDCVVSYARFLRFSAKDTGCQGIFTFFPEILTH